MKRHRQHIRRVAFAAAVLFLLLAATATFRAAPSPLAAVLASVLPQLKQQTHIPILLPDSLPPLASSSVYASAEGRRESYAIWLESDPDCDHAQACFLGIFRAKRGGKFSFPEAVRITGVGMGRFKGTTCGGSCSPPALEWKSGDVLYTVQLTLRQRDDQQARKLLVALAHDASQAGAR
jgi:hypothetical protein